MESIDSVVTVGKEQPLVSITVVTYNSSKFVIETLESAKAQTYQNIELIVSDDCSTDNTVELCQEWLQRNNSRFVRTELITTPVNTGVSANATRARKAAKGEWVKGIAGDDILVEDALEKFIALEKSDDSYLFFGECKKFSVDDRNKKLFDPVIYPIPEYRMIFLLPVEKQYKRLLRKCYLMAPCAFVRRNLYEKIGYYDETYKRMEDWPFWIKCLRNGYKVEFAPVLTEYYRQHPDSICSKVRSTWYNEPFYQDELSFKKKHIWPNISVFDIKYWWKTFYAWIHHIVFYHIFKNKKSKLAVFVTRVI